MNCPNCGGKIHRKRQDIQLFDENIGAYCVENVEYEECSTCGARFFPPETASQISEIRDLKLNELVSRRPISEFVTSAEAAGILGISRQALNKNRRVRRGFIFGTNLGKMRVFLRESVEQFRISGDGRFPLWFYNTP